MPMFHTEIHKYVQVRNAHQIRNNLTGQKPYMLYHHPEEGILMSIFQAETLNFCRTRLLGIRFDPENPPPIQSVNEAAPFRTAICS
ncbi:hypothetical protein BDV29DRAFT_179799 [Aspergillus leporis]|uniref:Uncharacterized protein n=1 Tax=Aspergillus leporis TaxID=41062 RepID=A0A5N5WRI9_9EURO|nr:hypothetical protein BDV29DRAFT_179799 [Aspergillus leporis]